ncbi:MAG TPA: hypothetical protein VGI75_04135, partial [Pirellulales bacterium]
MKNLRRARVWWLGFAVCVLAQPAAAITLQVDYTYDTSNFFGAGNPQGAAAGAQAKASLEAAASYFSSILTDSFSAITVPPPVHDSASNSTASWRWQEDFSDPTTGADVSVENPPLPANRFVIYAGGSNLTGTTLGIGAAGGLGINRDISGSGMFTQAENNQINTEDAAFTSAVKTRGQSSGFA